MIKSDVQTRYRTAERFMSLILEVVESFGRRSKGAAKREAKPQA